MRLSEIESRVAALGEDLTTITTGFGGILRCDMSGRRR